MASSFVPILNSVKNKNVQFLLNKLDKISTSDPTKQDFEDLSRKKTRLELILLSLVVFGIEICYAAETAFVSPVMQKIGVPVQFMTMVWGLSPIIGFFACPILGSLSDGCTSKLGRRRPFIIIFSLGIMIGLLLTGYGHVIGGLLWTGTGPNPFIIIITIIGVVLLDFDCDACQSPARAYLIDVSQAGDHSLGLSTFTVMAGAGGSLGYVLGGIPWAELYVDSPVMAKINHTYSYNSSIGDTLNNSNIAYDHKQILFTFVAIIYIICALISITSFKEIPLTTVNQTPDNIPSKMITRKMKYQRMENDFSIDEDEQSGSQNGYQDFEDRNCVENPSYQAQDYINGNAATDENYQNSVSIKIPPSKIDTLKYYLKSIIHMPSSLKWLCLTHFFCWMSLLCYSLYFTDFVGEEIYGGLPLSFGNDETTKILHGLYDKGVRIGSLCMAIYSISCSVYSFFLQSFMDHFRTKNVYLFSQITYSVGMLMLAITKNKWIAALTSLTAGIMYSSLFTIPFILVASYHSQESFELLDNDSLNKKNKTNEEKDLKRGLGTDLSLVSSMVFVAQFTLSFFIGSLIKIFNTKAVVVYAASFFSLCAAFFSNRLFYLD